MVADPVEFIDEATMTDAQRRDSITLGDGTRVPALNGCTNTGHLPWPGNRSKAPVVGIQRVPGGYDVYLHADGTMTTTYDVLDPNTGQMAAAGAHMRPVDLTDKPMITKPFAEDNRLDAAQRRARQRR